LAILFEYLLLKGFEPSEAMVRRVIYCLLTGTAKRSAASIIASRGAKAPLILLGAQTKRAAIAALS